MELLDIWRQAHLQTALRSNVRNKWIWEHVGDQLWHRGFVRSGEQCKNKVHNLLCVYRNVCRGRLPRWRCRYFDLLHRVATAKNVSELEDPAELAEEERKAVGGEPETAASPPQRLPELPGFPQSPQRTESRAGAVGSPPPGKERARRGPPALVPIQYRSAPANVKAAVGLPVTAEDAKAAVDLPWKALDVKPVGGLPESSDEVLRLLTRLWGHHLPADVLQSVSDAFRRELPGSERLLRESREAGHRSRPYPAARPPTSAVLPPRAAIQPPREVPVVPAPPPAEPVKSPAHPADFAEDLRGMVIARVPLLPVFKASSLSPPAVDSVHRPAPETPARKSTPPSGTHGTHGTHSGTHGTHGTNGTFSGTHSGIPEQYGVDVGSAVLRELASRGLLLPTGRHTARAGVIHINID